MKTTHWYCDRCGVEITDANTKKSGNFKISVPYKDEDESEWPNVFIDLCDNCARKIFNEELKIDKTKYHFSDFNFTK